MNRRMVQTAALAGCLTTVLGLLAACGTPSAAQAPGATAPSSASASAQAASTSAGGAGGRLAYLDDRSTGAAVIASLYNAINFKQYARAASYWQNTQNAPSVADFQTDYQGVEEVQLTIGSVSASARDGQSYATVPVALKSIRTDGSTQTFVGCYTLHPADPGMQTASPFTPWSIASAQIQQVDTTANTAELMAQACASR